MNEQMEQGEGNDELGADAGRIMKLVEQLMNKGGWDVIEEALSSQDPAQPIGAFIAQLIMQVTQHIAEGDEDMDLRVWLMPNGVVEHLLDMIERAFKLPPEFSDEIFKNVVNAIKASLQDPEQAKAIQAQQGQGQPQQAPQGGLQAMGGV